MLPILVAVALSSSVPGAWSSSGPRTLTIAADAKVTFLPDQVTANFSISATHRDQATAKKQAEEKLRQVVDALLASGVQPRHLVAPEGAPQPEYRGNEVIAYRAARSVSVTITDMARVDEALTAAVRAGGQPAGSVIVRHSNTKPFETKARLAAAATARERAAGIAEALGGKLGLPRVVSESGQTSPGQAVGTIVPAADGKVTTGYAATELSVLGQVHVQFDIQDAP